MEEKKLEKKYIPLAAYFQISTKSAITLTFSEIETIMGQKLPNASYLNKSWWKKTKPPLRHFLAWTNSGYYVSNIQLGYFVTFEKAMDLEDHTTTTENIPYIIRSAEVDDARDILQFENDNLHTPLFFYGEHGHSVQSLRKLLYNWRTNHSGAIFLAIVDGKISGLIKINRSTSSQIKHRASIKLNILQKYEHSIIPEALLKDATNWAKSHNIKRLETSLNAQEKAIQILFSEHGYEKEGIRKNALYFNECYCDEILMGNVI